MDLGRPILWVGALQVMLDEGRNHDGFALLEICRPAIIAGIGSLGFLIREPTEKNPIIDLRVFPHRGFATAAITCAASFGFAGVALRRPPEARTAPPPALIRPCLHHRAGKLSRLFSPAARATRCLDPLPNAATCLPAPTRERSR